MHENSKVAAEYFNMLDTDSDGILTIQDIIHHPELKKLNLSTQEGKDALLCGLTYVTRSTQGSL